MNLLKKMCFIALFPLCLNMAWAKDYTTLRFGVDASYAPFESKVADGSLKGFDIDLGNSICAKLQVKCIGSRAILTV